jgi:hypothetical protein
MPRAEIATSVRLLASLTAQTADLPHERGPMRSQALDRRAH